MYRAYVGPRYGKLRLTSTPEFSWLDLLPPDDWELQGADDEGADDELFVWTHPAIPGAWFASPRAKIVGKWGISPNNPQPYPAPKS